MLEALSSSTRFVKELKKFEVQIKKIQIIKSKEYGYSLLDKLQDQANKIDSLHNSETLVDIDGAKIRTHVDDLMNTKMEILKLINDSNS
jgi:hypothetical protein|tara:strand:- start:377 stop:643 length:267 start_codon:yes stop_codon:yes gene_type:complete